MRAARANPKTRGGGPDGPRMRQGTGTAGAWHGRRIRRPYGQTGHCIIARNTSATGKRRGGGEPPPYWGQGPGTTTQRANSTAGIACRPQNKKRGHCRPRGVANLAYSAWIAPVGQTPSQAPQSTQEAASTTALSSMLIAPTGQVSTHAPQATHSLVTV